MDSVTGSIYLEDPGVDRHHLIIWNIHSIFPSSWSYALLPSFRRSTQSCKLFIDPRNLCGSAWLGIPLSPLTLFLRCSRENSSFPHILPSDTMRGAAECWRWAVYLPAPPYHHTMMEWTERCTPRPWTSEFGHSLGGSDQASLEMHLEAVIVQTCRLYSSEFRDTLGGCDRASWEMHLEAMIEREWSSTWGRSMWRR